MTIIIGTPYTKGAGYYLGGKDDPKAKSEADIRTCVHCQAVIKMQAWAKSGAWCNKCMAPICKPCGKLLLTIGCVPFIKRIETHMEEHMRFERIGMPEKPISERQSIILAR